MSDVFGTDTIAKAGMLIPASRTAVTGDQKLNGLNSDIRSILKHLKPTDGKLLYFESAKQRMVLKNDHFCSDK